MNTDFPSAKVICHSRAPNGEELITLEVELHRFILSELNTHRSFSRNYQSSRAVPVDKMIEQVRNDPAIPVHWGKNQKGMVADVENPKPVLDFAGDEWDVRDWWILSAEEAANAAEAMSEAGYHKQIVNRLLEPFMRTKGVITATRDAYDAFFKLRCHKDAQPEIKLLAERMRDAIENSVPNKLNYGEYHLPYVVNRFSNREEAKEIGKVLPVEDAVKVSCSCTAQVSYRNLDQSLDKAKKIYDMLNLPVNGVYPDEPSHYSPAEHIAKVVNATTADKSSGNFHSGTFWQYRKALEMGMEDNFLTP